MSGVRRMRKRARYLSPAMREGLRAVAEGRAETVHGSTLAALERRRMITADDKLTAIGAEFDAAREMV